MPDTNIEAEMAQISFLNYDERVRFTIAALAYLEKAKAKDATLHRHFASITFDVARMMKEVDDTLTFLMQALEAHGFLSEEGFDAVSEPLYKFLDENGGAENKRRDGLFDQLRDQVNELQLSDRDIADARKSLCQCVKCTHRRSIVQANKALQ